MPESIISSRILCLETYSIPAKLIRLPDSIRRYPMKARQVKKTPGAVIQEILESKPMSAYRLSQLIGANKVTVGKIVATGGEAMTLQTFRSICAALQIHPSEILDQLPAVELPKPPPIFRRGPKTREK